MMNNTPAPFQSASLYVGDLHPEITESVLFDLFNRVGPVASIRVCRDTITKRSLGYAYVNFHNVQDAERALDTMNFSEIRGQPCRIMWSQRDPSLRKSGVGNIFVKNLPASIDNKNLYDIFSVYGNILSCKVVTDEAGKSKGYGYVHYETAEAAGDAIQKFNGHSIDEHTIEIGTFVRRNERSTPSNWTNIYIKQFPKTWSDAKLREAFSPFGEMTSVVVMKEGDESKGFGFINFADHEAAKKAVDEMNKKTIEENGQSYSLYVGRAQTKGERTRELSTQFLQKREEKLNLFQGRNLYVKNIDDEITDEELLKVFSEHGTVANAKIMREPNGTSKGFGFVCYNSSEEAIKAMNALNGTRVRSKPLVVTLHQRKDVRRQHLMQTVNERMRYFPQGPGPVNQMQYMYPMPGQGFPNQRFYNEYPRGGPNVPPRGPNMRAPFYPMPPYNMPQVPMNGQVPPNMKRMPGGVPMNNMRGPGMRGPNPGRGPMGARPQGVPGGRGIKFNNQVRNQPMQAQPMEMPVPSLNEPLDHTLLANSDLPTQKNMIGERLYPLVYEQEPARAGKITGMLLEMEITELLHLLESPDALVSKVREAIMVLEQHERGMTEGMNQ